MDVREMRAVINEVAFPDYEFSVEESIRGYFYLQAEYDEADTITGKIERQHTRRWPLLAGMTESEIVSTAFKCVITSMEHKTREWFTYKNGAIYGPHFDVNDLLAVCGKRDTRLLTSTSLPETDLKVCPYCGPICFNGAAHNARVEDGVKQLAAKLNSEPLR